MTYDNVQLLNLSSGDMQSNPPSQEAIDREIKSTEEMMKKSRGMFNYEFRYASVFLTLFILNVLVFDGSAAAIFFVTGNAIFLFLSLLGLKIIYKRQTTLKEKRASLEPFEMSDEVLAYGDIEGGDDIVRQYIDKVSQMKRKLISEEAMIMNRYLKKQTNEV